MMEDEERLYRQKSIEQTLPGVWRELQIVCHDQAIRSGFHDRGDLNTGEMIALMHSELSEALEGARHGNPESNHLPEFSQIEEEFADVVIRIAHAANYLGLDVGDAIVAKLAYNRTRPRMHGKEF